MSVCVVSVPLPCSRLGVPLWNSPVSQVSEIRVLAQLSNLGSPESLTNLLMYPGLGSSFQFHFLSSPLASPRCSSSSPTSPALFVPIVLYWYLQACFDPSCRSLRLVTFTRYYFDFSPTVLLLCTFFSQLFSFIIIFFNGSV